MERTLSQLLPGANKVVNALRLRSKAFIAGLIQRRGSTVLSVCESWVSFYKRVRTLAVGEESTFWRGRAPVGESAPLWGRARPFGGGPAPVGKGMSF